MRTYFLIASVVFGVAATFVQGQTARVRTAPIDEETQQMLASVFDDRSGPRQYQHDTVPPSQFLSASWGNELIGIHGFDAIGGKDIITSISCVWGDSTNGSAGRIFVWQADSQGNLSTAVPLVDQTVTVKDALTGRYCEYTLTTPVTVTGRFYVGYSAVISGWQSAYLVPTNTAPTPPGRAWAAVGSPGSSAQFFASDAVTLDPIGLCMPLRASGAAGAITYQGRLADNGSAFTGTADLRFRFFDSPSGASPLTPTFTYTSVPVTQGLFTTELPGDSAWFANAPDVYLETEVRRGTEAFVTLSPRQRITRAPAALHAMRAAAADRADNATTAQFATTAASATTATTAALAQSVPWSGVAGIPSNVASAFSPWTAATGGIAFNAGRVGIGTSTPAGHLHIASLAAGTDWQVRITNAAVGNPAFRTTGMRVSDDGFFEVANTVDAGAPIFARLSGNGVWSAVSDARLKTDVTPDDPNAMLAAALQLRPVHFRWKKTGTADSGLLAQEVRAVLPDLVTGNEVGGVLTVDYSKVGVIAVGAVQAQQAEIRRLREHAERSDAEVAALRARLERLEASLRDSTSKR